MSTGFFFSVLKLRHPSRIFMVKAPFFVYMYSQMPLRLAKSNMEKQYFCQFSNVVCEGSPSRILIVLRNSFGITTLPRSSMRRTIPVAFIFKNLLLNLAFTSILFAGDFCLYKIYLRIKFAKKMPPFKTEAFLPVFIKPKKARNKLLRKVLYQEDKGFWGHLRKAPFWRSFRWRLFLLRPVLL